MDRLDACGATQGGNWVCYGGTNDDAFGITRPRRGDAAADGILEFPSMGGWRARVMRRTRRCLDVAISPVRRRRNIDVHAMTNQNQATNLSKATGNIVLAPLGSPPCASMDSARSHHERTDPETVDVAPR